MKSLEENLTKALSIVSVVFSSILAISLFFILYDKNIETVNIVNSIVADRGAVYQSNSNAIIPNQVSGAAITGSITNGLETDILIGTITVTKSTSPDTFDFSLIDNNAIYSTEYILNEFGEITMIKYIKR